ncbi:hypothetical protein TOPH_01958 [Tolypocladium ophioglossoides CBS 100239]|uniref:Uncharacterized protein n=1 Tax=Tolypocladium ophioglossoides (strain CBS 100239) TaxID=1163406 RepID=A0A0L0NH47_TOLOC|nr:hypothetical protein TOPH_01958 [Tolypocladium ophioglossoides CBS 100239]
MASLRQTLYLVFLVTLFVFCKVLNAADFSQKREPEGPLQVRLDYTLASRDTRKWDGAHQWVFSTHLTFNGKVADITNGQLKKIAVDAYKEMEVDILQYNPTRDLRSGKPQYLPGAMTIMAFGNEIILSSSQRGNPAFINEVADSPVRAKLELCQIFWRDFVAGPNADLRMLDHKNQRKCGEIMAFHQYYQVHDQDISEIEPKARVTTVLKRSDKYEIIPPCGTDSDDIWGCDFALSEFFGEHAIVTYLGEKADEQDYDLDQLAGGVAEIDQIESCAQRGN